MNNIYFIIIAVILMIYIVHTVRKNKLSVKASFWWLIGSVIILLLSIFPYSINWLAEIFGIVYPPALLLTLAVVFLLFINFQDSRHISEQQAKITELAEQVALLKFEQSRSATKREPNDKKSRK
jgi:hypothetical protein